MNGGKKVMKHIYAAAVLAVAVAVGIITPAHAAPVLGTGTVLMIDSHRVESISNAYRQFYQGRKVNLDGLPTGQIAVEKTPQDSTLMDATTVLREGGVWRMYLRSGSNVGYRESSDGLRWNVVTPNGGIIVRGVNGGSVSKDPVNGRYYMVGWAKAEGRYVELVSTNGIDFTRTNFRGDLSGAGRGDVIHTFADPNKRSIVAIAKQRVVQGERCPKSSSTTYTGGRAFGVNVSPYSAAARYWNRPRVVLTTDCTDVYGVPTVAGTVRPVHLYGAPTFRYGDQHLSFPWLFRVTKAPPPVQGQSGLGDGPVDTQIASTPDVGSVAWSRPAATAKCGARKCRPVVIPRGAGGTWDDGMVYGTALVDAGDQSRLYYNGWDTTHAYQSNRKVRTGMVTWRKGRFMAMKSRGGTAKVRTRSFYVPANGARRTLHINASGTVRVAVLNAKTGRMFKGWEGAASTVSRGDTLDRTITWRGKRLGRLHNKPIKLQFTYTGSLYSWEVR